MGLIFSFAFRLLLPSAGGPIRPGLVQKAAGILRQGAQQVGGELIARLPPGDGAHEQRRLLLGQEALGQGLAKSQMPACWGLGA